MKSIVCALIISMCAWAEALPIVSMDSLLEQPMAHRLAQFKAQGFKGQEFLKRAAFDSTNPLQIRWRAITTMGRWDALRFRPELDKALASKEWFMRNAALVGLAEFAPDQGVSAARRLVKDPALVVRSAAVDVLVKNSNAANREILWNELGASYNKRGGNSLWIRGQIVQGLAQNPNQEELRQFSALLMEKDEEIQMASVQGLEKITKMKLGQGTTSRPRLVQLWKNYFNQPASTLR